MRSFRYILIVLLAGCLGLAGGYFWEHQEVKDLQGQIQGLMTELQNVSQASREQLAKAEAQAEICKLRVLVSEARCDVLERNFGRAEQRIDALEASLDKAFSPLGDQGIQARDAVKMNLEGVREGLKKLDIKVRAKIEELAKVLDQVLVK